MSQMKTENMLTYHFSVPEITKTKENDHTEAFQLLCGRFLFSPLEDVTQKLFFLTILSECLFNCSLNHS